MNMVALIEKKRDGLELSTEEIKYMIGEYCSGAIPDYQMSAMCMAILFRGMNDREILDLTLTMRDSGNLIDLSGIEGIKADKHSTGGVGDKTSLVLCPMVAACGLKIAKMSGRGLGHTGGTLDKLESIPGMRINLNKSEFFDVVNNVGFSIVGQTENIDPADKKLYALRDVTGTCPSVPLIVSSIMSKKLASGSDIIVLDVKVGEGSFMKTMEDAEELAVRLRDVGISAGKKCAAVISDMSQPLGYTIGNALEVKEAVAVLRGNESGELLDLCLTIGSAMLVLAGKAKDESEAAAMLIKTITGGSALNTLAAMVQAQGGDPKAIYDVSLLPKAKYRTEVRAEKSGYVSSIAAKELGIVSMELGGGRKTKEDVIDPSVGLVLNKKVGDRVEKGELLATVHHGDKYSSEFYSRVLNAFSISDAEAAPIELVKKIVL